MSKLFPLDERDEVGERCDRMKSVDFDEKDREGLCLYFMFVIFDMHMHAQLRLYAF